MTHPADQLNLPGLSLDMRRAISTLTEIQQKCFIDVCFYGYTEAEAANIFGLSRQTVNQHVNAAKEKLKKILG
jgi:DNA-directed RNA polymerase specialized sigma24 family protein